MTTESTTGYEERQELWCGSCSQVAEETEPLYECNSCGTGFIRSNSADGSSHQCPDCHRFASKTADDACPDCEQEDFEEDVFCCDDCDFATLDETEIREHVHEHNQATTE